MITRDTNYSLCIWLTISISSNTTNTTGQQIPSHIDATNAVGRSMMFLIYNLLH
jgi:hypothetical protein